VNEARNRWNIDMHKFGNSIEYFLLVLVVAKQKKILLRGSHLGSTGELVDPSD
jgi:hypothetical protein